MTISIRNSAKALIIRNGEMLVVKYADQGGEYYALPGGGQHHRDFTQLDIFWLPIRSNSEFRFYPKSLTRHLNQPIPDQIEYWGSVE